MSPSPGGGLVGLSLAYELVTRGATVTLIDAGLPGRATDAGAGILSPGHHSRPRAVLVGLGCMAPATITRTCSSASAPMASTPEAPAMPSCGLLSVGLRDQRGRLVRSLCRPGARPRSGHAVAEITAGGCVGLFPPLGQVHRALRSPGRRRVDGRGMAEALRRGRPGPRVCGWCRWKVCGAGRARAGSADPQRERVGSRATTTCGAGPWPSPAGPGARRWGMVGLPPADLPHEGPDRASRRWRGDSGTWPIVQPLLTHYLVPWPGGRVACGGTFEPGAGFSTPPSRPAGLHELLRECLVVAPGLADSALPPDPGRPAPHLTRRPPRASAPSRGGTTSGWRRATGRTGCCSVPTRAKSWPSTSREPGRAGSPDERADR